MSSVPDPALGPPVAGDPVAAGLRGFGPLGIVAMLAVLLGNLLFRPLSALLVLAWAKRSRTPWRAIGFGREPRWARTIVLGVVGGITLKLLMKAVVMPLLGADPINHTYHYLVGNRAALPGALYLMIVGAGFGEETVFRGWLFERLGRGFGQGRVARLGILVLTSVLFGAAHLPDQGLAGAEQATLMGFAFGSAYLATERLWLPMILHAVFDLTALVILYYDLEARVAHLVFH